MVLVDRIYSVWAARRLQLTGRPDLDTLLPIERASCHRSGSSHRLFHLSSRFGGGDGFREGSINTV